MSESLLYYFSWEGQQLGVLVYLIVILANTLLNASTVRRLDSYPAPDHWPSVSILIPARNEEATIRRCVESLAAQDYPDYDLWVLDDLSTDNTAAVLDSLTTHHAQLNVITGQPLPTGWLGKPWACEQLAQASGGEMMLFVDSDTWHHPRMLRDAIAALESEQADLLSVIPDEIIPSLAEKLSVPIISWSLFTHFPLTLAQRLNWPPLTAAIGQMILFRRTAYRRIGGHAAVRTAIAEDLSLARHVARSGGRWRLLDGVSRVHCRMYRSWPEAWSGLGKNLFASFGGIWQLYLFIWGWLGFAYLLPFLSLVLSMAGYGGTAPWLGLLNIGIAIAIWTLYVWRLRTSRILVPLYPLVIMSAFFLAAHSLDQRWRGRASWKGRALQ